MKNMKNFKKLNYSLLITFIMLLIIIKVNAGKIKPVELTPDWIGKIKTIAPEKPSVSPAKKRIAFLFSLHTGFKHWVIPHTAAMIKVLGEKSGAYEVVESDDVKMFEPGNIKQFDIIILNNTCSDRKKRDMFYDVTEDEEKAAMLEKSLIDHIANGNGLVALHGGIVMQNNSPEFSKMLGDSFDFHPKQQDLILKLDSFTYYHNWYWIYQRCWPECNHMLS